MHKYFIVVNFFFQLGVNPSIHIWNSANTKILAILADGHERGIMAVAFNYEGDRLASIGMDDHHTVVVWLWRNGKRIATARYE